LETVTIFLPSLHLKHRDHYLWPEKGDGKASYMVYLAHSIVQFKVTLALLCSCTQEPP